MIAFLFFFVSIEAKYLRHCMYFDRKCKDIASCEFQQFDVCVSMPTKEDKTKYKYHKIFENKKGEVFEYQFDDEQECKEVDGVEEQNAKIGNFGECVDVGNMNVIETIVDDLDTFEQHGALGYLSNATYVYEYKKKELKACSLVSPIQVIYNKCVEVDGRRWSKASIINNVLTLQTFKDKDCTQLIKNNIESKCDTCIEERFGEGIMRSTKLKCIGRNKIVEKNEKEL